MKTRIYTHKACLDHITSPGHPDQAHRLEALYELFEKAQLFSNIDVIEAPLAEKKDLYLAHPPFYVGSIEDSIPQYGTVLLDDGDTEVSPGSEEAAYRSVGAVIKAVDDVMNKETETAFCAVRPPGHHAISASALGFCIFSNLFIGARYAQEQYGVKKIAIVDFDLHHGNGTELLTRNAKDIFFISSHQFPFFPGTGDPQYDLKHKIMSLPLSAGDDGSAFRKAYEEEAFPALNEFKPELIMISAGFDGHRDDPTGDLNLLEEDYAWITKEVKKIAAKYCDNKIISVLEGGYNMEALKNSVTAHIKALST